MDLDKALIPNVGKIELLLHETELNQEQRNGANFLIVLLQMEIAHIAYKNKLTVNKKI